MIDEPPTIAPEFEPEYVGAHSALSDDQCQNYTVGNAEEGVHTPRQCETDATHTVVMADGNGLHEIAMCDECGDPEDVDRHERDWTGEVID